MKDQLTEVLADLKKAINTQDKNESELCFIDFVEILLAPGQSGLCVKEHSVLVRDVLLEMQRMLRLDHAGRMR